MTDYLVPQEHSCRHQVEEFYSSAATAGTGRSVIKQNHQLLGNNNNSNNNKQLILLLLLLLLLLKGKEKVKLAHLL